MNIQSATSSLPRRAMTPPSASDTAAKPLAKWTILQYAASDNNLYKWIYDDVAMMEKTGSDDQTQLVVQIDHGQRGPGGVQRLHLEKSGGAPVEGPSRQSMLFMAADPQGPNGTLKSPVAQNLGQLNMSDPHTLADFIEWGEKNYPAEHYMLIVSDHGDAWKGCCEDSGSNGWMDLPALKAGLAEAQQKTGNKLDIVGFDACLMANAEVAYQLKDQANYLVGSEQTEGGDGWPYQAVLNPKSLDSIKAQNNFSAIDLEPGDLAASVVRSSTANAAQLPTMSAIDLSKMDGLAKTVSDFKDALVATPTSGAVLQQLRRETQSFTGYSDLYHFAEKVATSGQVTDPRLKTEAQDVMSAVKGAVIAEQHNPSYAGAHGLTVELNRTNDKYAATDFAQATNWASAVQRLNRAT